jgi:hypothetical protein
LTYSAVLTPRLNETISLGHAGRWCLPVFWCGLAILLLANPNRMLSDPDTQWHIAVGETIWRSGMVPHVDLFSHTFAGAPWIARDWLTEVIFFAAYAAGGWSGVTLLAAATIATTYTVLLAALMRRAKVTVAVILVLVAALLAFPQFIARPLIFFLFFAVIWVDTLLRAAERGGPPPLWLLAVVVLWANVHASFTVSFVLAAIIGLEAVLRAPLTGGFE